MSAKASKPLHEIVRELELEEFPELSETVDELWTGVTTKPILAPKGPYAYFAPSYHIQRGLVGKTIIEDLRKGKKMLSVGSGPAYLERLLVNRFGVDPNNITLSDISTSNVPEGFNFHQFDMYGQWPDFGQSFDYIIFPESLCDIGITRDFKRVETEGRVERATHLFRQSLRNLNPYGQARFDGYVHRHIFDEAIKRVHQENPNARLVYRGPTMILSKAT